VQSHDVLGRDVQHDGNEVERDDEAQALRQVVEQFREVAVTSDRLQHAEQSFVALQGVGVGGVGGHGLILGRRQRRCCSSNCSESLGESQQRVAQVIH